MLAWKEKVADRLARLLADSPVSPSPAQAAVAPSQAKSFPAEPFIPPKTSSLSSYVFSLLPTSNLGHEQNLPCSETLRPLPPESLPKKWRGSNLTWKDPPLELSEESGSESERDERNGNFGNDQVLQSYRSINNSNGNEETSTSDCAGTLCYLTEKSMFVSPKLFAFFQSSLPGTLKGCHWVLLYSTWKHGISLRTLLRRSENIQGPCLLIVGDMQGAVFGGLLNSPLRPTEKRKYQGTNQTFVFTTIHGEPRLFRPTGANRFYYLCLNDALAFGGGGSFALCVDEDLLRGSSGSCETFGNSCLAYSPEFELKNVEVAHILFVDSPVGAGFSFSRDPKGYYVGEISSSLQLHKFLNKWFNEHPEYLANPFYIGGESYAGKTVPFLAQMISEGVEAGMKSEPNLKGYLVGNPSTEERIDFGSRVPFAHGFGIISHQLYETILGHCHGEDDYSNPANELCGQTLNTFNDLISQVQNAHVQNAHVLLDQCIVTSSPPVPNGDYSRMDGGSASDGSRKRKILREEKESRVGQLSHPPAPTAFSCFYYSYDLSYFWANDRRTRDALGIKEGTVDEWVRCHDEGELPYERDLKSAIKYHRNLTSRGYRALVFSGDHDLLVPHLGTQAWVRSLNFSIVDEWRAWHLGGQSAGFTISYSNNMTFATIKGGGHTAPEYEPERCFAMFSRWMLNRPL